MYQAAVQNFYLFGHPRPGGGGGNLSLFEITRASVLFSRKFRRNLKFYKSENFSDYSLNHILESENFKGFLCLRKIV